MSVFTNVYVNVTGPVLDGWELRAENAPGRNKIRPVVKVTLQASWGTAEAQPLRLFWMVTLAIDSISSESFQLSGADIPSAVRVVAFEDLATQMTALNHTQVLEKIRAMTGTQMSITL